MRSKDVEDSVSSKMDTIYNKSEGFCWRTDEDEGGNVRDSTTVSPKLCKILVCLLHGGGVRISPYLY